MKEPTLADKLYDAIRTEERIESQATDALLEAVGIDLTGPDDWPMEDFTFDPYDYSYEFKGVKVGWCPSGAQLAATWALGFHRCWICYKDGTEKYFASPLVSREPHKT